MLSLISNEFGHAWTSIRSVLDINQIDISRRLIGRHIGAVAMSERKRRPLQQITPQVIPQETHQVKRKSQ